MRTVPCVLMRGGTSKGPVFLANHLPTDPQQRDEVLLSLMGSGHELEIDGIGGGSPQTSKVAIVSRSPHPDADVDYLFVQVMVTQRRVDTAPNCGNMLCAIGPFAIEHGLVNAGSPMTRVRIRNLNTNTFVDSDVMTPSGRVRYDGDTAIDGVPGTAAPIKLTFLNAAGAKTGRLLPTGRVRDEFDGVVTTCIDMAMPMVLMNAEALGKTGYEPPAELDADSAFLQRLERIRLQAGLAMGLGDVSQMVIPKPVLLAPARHGGTLNVRYFMPHTCHRSVAATGAIGLATACALPGSVAHEVAPIEGEALVRLEHPGGQIEVSLQPAADGNPEKLRASLVRTARRLFSGEVYIPSLRRTGT
ncbi:4-oxalomesaconate tautomerase [Pseudomonas sp. o96-267]|uniref:4-oxalomesaconate tautomerase n=1 Tax=Pseudomonas sp. o96-267 TaxID=2479853 RepID=UPI000F7B07D2|nr:4-oxalomesaconate tautomerase [Pseudomonas sp. o96-267]RRV23931.1 4-oxalomesaconate tautomerase [Pseudomonas sp. o96-267]